MMPFKRARRETTLMLAVGALSVLGLGIAMLYVSGRDDWMAGRGGLQSVVEELGGLLVASVALGVLWELVGRRAFAREILDHARTAVDVETTGLTQLGMRYLEDPDWERLFAGVRKLDIFLAYGRTWRNINDHRLRSLARRGGARVRVYLPDPQDTATVAWLADRFSMEAPTLRAAIVESAQYYLDLVQHTKADVEVYYRRGEGTFSCYRFDDIAVLTLYSHGKKRTHVPTIVCHSGGSLYDFIRDEFRAIEAQSRKAIDDQSGSS